MSGLRKYSNAVARQVKAAVARGESIRAIGKRLGMSPSTVSNMSRGRIYRPKAEVKRERAARAAAARDVERLAVCAPTLPTGAVAAAKAERDNGQPLVVESLEQRLERCLPGAVVHRREDGLSWFVWGFGMVLGDAASKREAVERSIALRGGR